MPSSTTPQRGHLYWAQVPYLPQRPLDVLDRGAGQGEVRAALTFKIRPVLVVQNGRDNNLLQEHIGSLPGSRMPELNVKLALSLDLAQW